MGKNSRSGSGMNVPDHIFWVKLLIFGVKILEFLDADADLDPGSGNIFDPGSGIKDLGWKKFGSGNLD
jgi:hypothetical protein